MRYLDLWSGKKWLTNDFWRQYEDLFRDYSADASRGLGAFSPSMDIAETDKGYLFKFDIPGLEKDQINVEVREGILYVSGERTRQEKSDGEFLRYERVYGKFERAVTLPADADAESVRAKYKNGVLELVIGKSVGASAKKVEISE